MDKNSYYVNNEISKCLVEGKKSEDIVMNMLNDKIGGKCYHSSFTDDVKKHVDLWWETPKGTKLGIDVKGIKKNNRKDSSFDDKIQWIEIKNTQGDKGWIYGNMDYIAFMTLEDILFVKPYSLYGYILNNTIGKQLVHVNPNEFYVPYQRNGRKDVIIKVPTTDIREISQFKIII